MYSLYKGERKQEIMDILNETGYATVEFLSKKLHISPSSIRRDLTDLERRGEVVRSYGGVELVDRSHKNIPFAIRTHESEAEKKRIALSAAKLVNEGDVVFVDGSSTAFFLFEELSKIKGITIVTNSIDGLSFLSNYQLRVISTGGIISNDNRSVLVGHAVRASFEAIHADICFFSAQSLNEEGVATDPYLEEIPLRMAMCKNSKKRVLLCDSKKLGKTSIYHQCTLGEVDFVICDEDISKIYSEKFPNTEFITAK